MQRMVIRYGEVNFGTVAIAEQISGDLTVVEKRKQNTSTATSSLYTCGR